MPASCDSAYLHRLKVLTVHSTRNTPINAALDHNQPKYLVGCSTIYIQLFSPAAQVVKKQNNNNYNNKRSK